MGKKKRWALFSLVVSCAAVIGACRKDRNTGATAAASASSAAVSSVTNATEDADAKSDDQRVAVTRSFASFRKDILDECTDMTILAPPGTERSKVEDAAKSAFSLPKGEKGHDIVPLNDPCVQFSDRKVMASCEVETTEQRDAGAVTVALSAYYFNVRTAKDSDAYMRDCLQMGGKWRAAKSDDPDVARERIRQRAVELQRIVEKATPP